MGSSGFGMVPVTTGVPSAGEGDAEEARARGAAGAQQERQDDREQREPRYQRRSAHPLNPSFHEVRRGTQTGSPAADVPGAALSAAR